MIRLTPLLVALLTAIPLPFGLRASLPSARQAQAMLGPDTWSRVLELQNERPSRYPEKFHATVFEFNDMLWFYTAIEGTQSLSIYASRLERDKAALGPLLREIEPGFTSFAELPDRARAPPSTGFPRLPNGCFIESLHELRRRVAAGEPITDAGLLAVYYHVPMRGQIGHTGLLYTTPKGRFFWDPDKPKARRRVPADRKFTELKVARRLNPEYLRPYIERARYVPVSASATTGELYARRSNSADTPGEPREGAEPVTTKRLEKPQPG